MRSLGRLDFIVKQESKILLKIFYLEGLDLWFKHTSEPTPITKEQAMHLIDVWQANHDVAKARISGGLIPYLESNGYKEQVHNLQQLQHEKRITLSGVF